MAANSIPVDVLLDKLRCTYDTHLSPYNIQSGGQLQFIGRIEGFWPSVMDEEQGSQRTIVAIEDPNMKSAVANIYSAAKEVQEQLKTMGIRKEVWKGITTDVYGNWKIWVQEPIHPLIQYPNGTSTFQIQGNVEMWTGLQWKKNYEAGFNINI